MADSSHPQVSLRSEQLAQGQTTPQPVSQPVVVRAFPPAQLLHQQVEAQVKQNPEALAVICGHETLTYQGLNDLANQLAHHLQSLGVGPEMPVGLCLRRSPRRMVGLLAILKAGGVYLPLDPDLPQGRLAFILEDTKASVVITKSTLIDRLNGHPIHAVDIDQVLDKAHLLPSENPVSQVNQNNLAYIIYTSGSTGQPKGVLVEHQAISGHCQTIVDHYQLTPRDRVLQFASIGFDVSLEQILPTLIAGATLVMPTTKLMESTDFHGLLHNFHLTVINLPPLVWSQWLEVFRAPSLAAALPDLRLVICGGDEMSSEALKVWQKSPLQSVRLLNAYGPTEATITALIFEIPPKSTFQHVPIGRPLPGREAYILDSDLQPVPVGATGELYIGGHGLARGYLNQPTITQDKFINTPWLGAAPNAHSTVLYKTGDLARYQPDGQIEFLGRIDHQVKIRGFRIELGEIEATLRQHPQVKEAVVIARKEQRGERWLCAYVVPIGPVPTVGELHQWVKQALPSYMVPAAFVLIEALPLTTNGKVDRQALPVPQRSQRAVSPVLTSPRTDIEVSLAQIWCDLLRLEAVGIDDDFFALGGHSLLATQAVSRIRDVLMIEVPLRTFFELPTLAELGAYIEQQGAISTALSLQPIARTEALPLSFAQQRLWFLDQLEGHSATYNITVGFQLTGPLNSAVLEQAFTVLVQRHEVLRTTFKAINGHPIQVIASDVGPVLTVVDLQPLPALKQALAINRLAHEIANEPFSLKADLPIRAKLLTLADSSHVLLIATHHIASDGWSMGILMRELSILYQDFVQNQPPSLPDLPLQYADFAHWQRQWLSAARLEHQLHYWQQQLADAPALLSLPTDHPRPPQQTFQGKVFRFHLEADLSQQLQELSQQSGTTLFITLLSAFFILLYRYSHSEDIVVGSPIANRNHLEIEPLIGFFANTLPLRANLSSKPSFLAFLRRIHQVALDAYSHQDLPFEKLVEALKPERNLSYSPLFQVMFVLQNATTGALELPNIQITPLALEEITAKFDLTLSMQETDQGLTGVWEYNSNLFEPETIQRFQGHFQTLLRAIVAEPNQSVATLPLLTPQERDQLLGDWNHTGSRYPREACIHHLFEAQAKCTPDAIAVVYAEAALTYQALNVRANRLAHYLRQLGVGPGMLIGLCLERSLNMIVVLLSILKAGGAYVPLDPTYPQARLAHILSDAALPIVLTQQSLVRVLPDHKGQLICVDTVLADMEQGQPDRSQSENPTVDLSAQDLAYVIYTSGSTGRPKGVLIAHQGICNLARAQQKLFDVQCHSHILQFASLSFDASVWEIFMALGSGASLILADTSALMPGEDLQQTLRNYHITHVTLPPSALACLRAEDLPRLKHIIVAGEACPPSLIAEWAVDRYFYNAYGPTESTVCATIAQVSDGLSNPPIGRPIANTQVYVLDPHGQLVPVGVPGELYIGGDGVAKGYWQREQLTRERFIPNPFGSDPSDRLYKTGDLVRYWPDGNLEFLGRLDHQVKIRGFRIELGEVESAIAQHPAVKDVVVIAREYQSGDQRLIAYLVPQSSPPFDLGTLRHDLKQQLPSYMVPSAFVTLAALPLSPNGKVDRRALPELAQASDLDSTGPRNATEAALGQIWCELLQCQQVGIDDNFFELGGHSLLATQVVSRIRDTFAVELPLRTFFESPTVAELGQLIATQQPTLATVAIQPTARTENLPLSFAQQRLWFLNQLDGQSATYNIATAFQLIGAINISALEQAIASIIQRHEVLRTTFQVINKTPVQVINPVGTVALPIIDLQSLAQAEQSTAMAQQIRQAAHTPFDLSQDHPIRIKLLKLALESHVLLVTLHHIAADGWSIGIFNRELSVLYGDFCQGQPSSLPELPLQYADFAHWQRQWLQGEIWQRQLSYWQQHLAGAPACLDLPTDHPRPPLANL